MNQTQIEASIKANGTYSVDGIGYVVDYQPQIGNIVDCQGARAIYEATANTVAGWLNGTDTVMLYWEILEEEAEDAYDTCDWSDSQIKWCESTHKANVLAKRNTMI
jgi:hypothetical protein